MRRVVRSPRPVAAAARARLGTARLTVAVGLAVLAASVGPTALAAQAAPAKPKSPWTRSMELAGSLFIGNRPQTVLTTRARTSHRDSTFEFGADMRFTYGEQNDDGERVVSQRLWFGTLNMDVFPHAYHSPFLLGTAESSFEKRIDLRLNGGIGHKMTFVDRSGTLVSLSVAVLAEHSRIRNREGELVRDELSRLSIRLRTRRKMNERAEVSQESYFRPEVQGLTQYTFTNSVSAGYRMNETVALKLSYLDNYDSGARGRGADSNYDGQFVVGLQADF